jgi:hypothetical protein
MLGINGMTTDSVESALLEEDRDDERDTVTAGQVAKVVAGIPAIGQACEALRAAGWRASIAANRITVDDEVFAVLIGATSGTGGGVEARWVIYRIAGTPPVWIVGAESAPRDTPDPATRASMAAPSAAWGRSTEHRLLNTSLPRTHVGERRWI